MDESREQLDRVDRACLVESGGARGDSLSWNLSRVKQGDAIRVDSTCSRRRRQVCKCGCFNHGNVCSSERDDRLGSLEVSAVAVIRNLRSTVRLTANRTRRSVKCSNETESSEESGHVGKRDDAMQLRWNVSRRFARVKQW